MPLYALNGEAPTVPEKDEFWIAPDAHVIGKVKLGTNTGIWFGAVLRGDNEPITIGANSNVQEGAMVHVDPGFPVEIGEGCTIGHHAIIHGCSIGSNSLIGMGSTVLNGAKIGNNCLVGAGALVTEGKEFPDGSLIVGVPAKFVRKLDEKTIKGLKNSALGYVQNWRDFARGLVQID